MLRRVVWLQFTDVSEVFAASDIQSFGFLDPKDFGCSEE
jgi:hypothetical protein